MSYRAEIYRDIVRQKKFQLDALGGLPDAVVHNTEWLYMLEEDTRNSLSIEGYFATEEEIKAALAGRKTAPEIVNYYRAAQTVYDQALQYYRDKDLHLDLSAVRHIHSELFREVDVRRGEFRKGGIQILGAKVQPPEFDVASYVRAAITLTLDYLAALPILSALARAHALFESIHPFHDGNGRVGRILLNFLAVSQGYPPIVIKGLTAEERNRYYAALEQADIGFHHGFPDLEVDLLRAHVEQGRFESLETLLSEGLLPRLDLMMIAAIEAHEPLMDLAEVASILCVKEESLRQRVHRGTLVAVKRGKKLYSHPRLALPDARKRL